MDIKILFFRTTRYLKYMLRAGHGKGHGIHSPFVFDLVSRVFRNKIDPDIVSTVESIRKKLISDRRLINVRDLGSGSEKQKKGQLKISQIARLAPVPIKYGVLLHNMAAEFGESLILELGTSLGISTMYLASSRSDLEVKTIEGCPATSEIARENFVEAGLKNIEVLTGDFDEVLPVILNAPCKPGLIFIDGNHRKEPVLRYFTQIAKIADSKKVVIIDDINFSKEMGEAWEEIKRNENVSVTVDILRLGIVFFRKGITPKNYIIRY